MVAVENEAYGNNERPSGSIRRGEMGDAGGAKKSEGLSGQEAHEDEERRVNDGR